MTNPLRLPHGVPVAVTMAPVRRWVWVTLVVVGLILLTIGTVFGLAQYGQWKRLGSAGGEVTYAGLTQPGGLVLVVNSRSSAFQTTEVTAGETGGWTLTRTVSGAPSEFIVDGKHIPALEASVDRDHFPVGVLVLPIAGAVALVAAALVAVLERVRHERLHAARLARAAATPSSSAPGPRL